ncbi:hypothetical protein [Amycolatopsis solani]|uniref:hypothetical protein n=1 Tax=Amycolatopsis solani TaxID=3028615 RepID=UPI0025B25736|nr:hypothetical protein [Amycolatopsis sp. MEP2-6]
MTKEFELYDRVRLVTDRFAGEGALGGSIGYVIEKYDGEAWEIEVSDPRTGETVARFVAGAADLERADPG